MTLLPSADRFAEMVAHREHLHRHPEVGIDLPETHQYVRSALERLGLQVDGGEGVGLVARIPGQNSSSQPIVFRADMDALPIDEDTGETFSSTRPGAMHACGHDLHTATLLGVVADLLERPAQRDVVVAFQPGEESDRGAVKTLQLPPVQLENAETFAVHVNAVIPVGSYLYSRHTFMAFGDWFRVTFRGAGGHASAPERVGNPIRAGAQFQEALVRHAKALSLPEARMVATTTEFLAGNTVNVIPSVGALRGTLRSVTGEQRSKLIEVIHREAQYVAAQNRLEADVIITEGYPAVVNDEHFVNNILQRAGAGAVGEFEEMDHPSMVIEDYSYFLARWPGAMFYVGAAVGDSPSFNHSSTARFSSEAMKYSFQLFRLLAPPV